MTIVMPFHCPRIYFQNFKYPLIYITISLFLVSFLSLTIQTNFLSLSAISSNSSSNYQLEITDFYPHLPIQILTKNRQKFIDLENKTKKLILIANPFFTDPTWSINSLKYANISANFSELHCSFVSDHCELSRDLTRYSQADAVVYHPRDLIDLSSDLVKYRNTSQRFVMTLWEPPINTPDLRSLKTFFNWSMTYRFDSHIFAPYYTDDAYRSRTNINNKTQIDQFQTDDDVNEEHTVLYKDLNLKKKKGTAAALISNCGTTSNRRWLLILELQKYVDVTIYGKCGHPCPKPSHNPNACRKYLAERYYFVLSFENSYCTDYATEKLFRMLKYPIVPILFGKTDYTRYIPSSGFLDVRQFSNLEDLANRLLEIKSNATLYEEYFHWKKDLRWGGFLHFMSPFCDLCLRLHLDEKESIIQDIHQWWFDQTCEPQVKNYFVT